MFDLEGKNIKLNNAEELKILFEYANKHGWRWKSDESELNTSFRDGVAYPLVICFKNNKKVCWNPCNSNTDFKDIEKYLKPEKEMTAKEFIEWFIGTALAYCNSGGRCPNCKLNERNTKCGKSLCNTYNWANYIDEIIEIAKSDNVNIPSEKKAINDIEKLIEDPDNTKMSDGLIESLKLAVEKLKEVK